MILAIGFFDGVHIGHQAILSGADAALTFREHPLSVLAPSRAPALIMSADERIASIRACKIRDVFVWPFTRELAQETPAEFLANLRARLGLAKNDVLAIRAGENWRFGRDGAGDANFLRENGIATTIVPYALFANERVSSTRIRENLANGNLAMAEAMLARPWSRTGTVVRGKGLGTRLGRPTINVRLDDEDARVKIPFGVYAVEVANAPAIANYGFAPTAGEAAWREPTVEVHFPFTPPPKDAAENSRLTIAFRHLIRREKKFESFELLAKQIEIDLRACSDFLNA